MTGYIHHDYHLVSRNIPKVRTLAKAAGVSSVLITSKGEPLLHFDGIARVCEYFKDFPLELQTNGIYLSNDLTTVKNLKDLGIDVIAISVDSFDDLDRVADVLSMTWEMNMTNRICLNLTNMIPSTTDFREAFNRIKCNYNLNQLLIRNIMVPRKTADTKEAEAAIKWIAQNAHRTRYNEWLSQFRLMIGAFPESDSSHNLIRVLPHGAEVFDLDGIAVSFSDYCLQEANNTEDIRSLIFLEDGHMYTAWDKQSSRLF
jgi:hypothetical protein